MATQIQIRRDTTAGWAEENPVLAEGELGLDTDLNTFKIGNGTATWSELAFYAGSGDTIVPLPDFLTYVQGRSHLSTLNTNFGWNSEGLWFGSAIGESDTSYPVFTNFTIGQNDAVVVEFNVDIQDECSDIGVCVYLDEDTPEWAWGINQTRIAAQFDCLMPVLLGLTEEYQGERSNIPNPGIYRVKFTYNPIGGTPVQFEYYQGSTLINSMTLNETLGAGSYRVGFASDNNNGRTYISDLSIMVNEDTPYTDTLQNGSSGASTDIADFVFDLVSDEGTESRMTIHNHDMRIRTTRDDADQDADISIDSADDVWIRANDEVEISAANSEVRIITGDGEQNTWNFRQDGLIGFDGDTGIESLDNNDVKSRIKFEPANGRALLQAYGNNNTATFTTGDWDTATWITVNPGLSLLTLTNTPGILSFMDNTGYLVDVLKISVNGGDYGIYVGASSGDGAIAFDIQNVIPVGDVTVTEVQFQYAFSSKVDIDFDESELVIRTEDEMTTVIDSDDTLTLRSRTNQTRVQANSDVTFTANYGEDSQYVWKMRQDGRFEFPTQGYIKSLFGASSDGNNYDTFEIIPDFGRYDDGADQYLVIEPTQAPDPEAPGHIHIRAGGDIDQSTADLIIGGEKNRVQISDTERVVGINTRPAAIQNSYTNLDGDGGTTFVAYSDADIQVGYTVNVGGTDYTVDGVMPIEEGIVGVTANGAVFEAETSYTFTFEPDYENQWIFAPNGVFYGPAMGQVRVNGITNAEPNQDLGIYASDAYVNIEANYGINVTATDGDVLIAAQNGGKISLSGADGAFLGNPDTPNNRITTRQEVPFINAAVPTSSIGQEGDEVGLGAMTIGYIYYCTGTYDGTTHIWKRVAWSNDTWGV